MNASSLGLLPKAIRRDNGLSALATGAPRRSDVARAALDSVMTRRPDWLTTGKATLLFQGGAEANPNIKDVPSILDAELTHDEREAILFLYEGQGIGRPFLAPPDLPPQQLQALRAAFDATMRDEQFIADVKKQKLDLTPRDGRQLEALINRIYATPKPVVDRVREAIK